MKRIAKRAISLFLSITLMLNVFYNTTIFTHSLSFIEIYTVSDLVNINNDLSENYRLMANLDLDGITWAPIGTSSDPFTGLLDGNGYTISNLRVGLSAQNYVGFFGYSTGRIENLKLEDIQISGSNYTGGLVGRNNGDITNCSITGVSSITGNHYTGALAGYHTSGTINNSSAMGQVKGNNSAGGFIGYFAGGLIEKCFSACNVDASNSSGGFVGYALAGAIENCYSIGNVAVSTNSGGFVGFLANGGSIENCYSVSNNYNGFNSNGTVTNCYFDNKRAGNLTKAHGRATEEMNQEITYAGWDFDNIWIISSGDDYPKLRTMTNAASSDCIEIYNASQLNNIHNNLFGNYKLMADIDLSNRSWTPIGTSSDPFKGFIDGNGYVIKNLDVNLPTQNHIGFIGYNRGTIIDLTIEKTKLTGKNYIGGIAGYNTGGISNCSVKGSSTQITGAEYTGGFVGYNTGLITDSDVTNISSIIGDSYIGGFVGYNNSGTGGNIINCSSIDIKNINVTGRGYNGCVGGFVGQNYDNWNAVSAKILNCWSTDVNISAANTSYVGGFVGNNIYGFIKNSYAMNDVRGNYAVGGFVGFSDGGTIEKCFAVGEVSASMMNAGGFVGYIGHLYSFFDSSTIRNCFSNANIFSGMSWEAAGFAGGVDSFSGTSIIENCYSVSNYSNNYGFINGNATITSSYFDNGNNNSFPYPYAKTTQEMMKKSTYTGWDFNNAWYFGNNYPYPLLKFGKDASRYYGIGTYGPTGNYSQSFTDMTVPSVIGDITITHTYNSLDSSQDTILSRGFSFGYSMHIDTQGIDRIVILPTGQRWTFELKNGKYEAVDSRGILVKKNNGYELTTLDQVTYLFDNNGAATGIKDNKGNELVFTTGISGNIESITDSGGMDIRFIYNLNKQIYRVEWRNSSNAVLASATYTYDNSNRLSSVTDMNGRTTTYLYNNDDLLSSIKNNLNQTIATITYDGSEGLIAAETDITGNTKTYKHEPDKFKTTITDSNGRKIIQHYDRDFSIIEEINAEGMTSKINYSYLNGENKYVEPRSTTDMYGNLTRYVRDVKGNVINVINPDNGKITYTYDNFNNKTSETNAEGGVTWYIYDSNGINLMREVRVINGTYIHPETVGDFEILYTSHPNAFEVIKYTYYPSNTYSKKGLVQYEYGPMGDNDNKIEYVYNSFGGVYKKILWIDGISYTTTYIYDALRRLASETNPDGTITTYDYNTAGDMIRQTISGAEGVSVTRTVYDNLGRKVQEIGPDEYNSIYDSNGGYSDLSAGTRYYYNSKGFLEVKTDPEGNETEYEYDDYGNVTKEILANKTHYFQMDYDKLNRQISLYFKEILAPGNEILMSETNYTQSGKNYVVTVTEYPGNLQAPLVTIDKYDYAGRLLESIAADGTVTTKKYNKNGNVISEESTMGDKTTYNVDEWGRIIEKTTLFDSSGDAVTKYEYDKNGNVTKESVKNNRSGQNDSYRVTEYRNDPLGNVLAVISMDASTAANYIISRYDWSGQLIEQYKGLSVVDVDYQTLEIDPNASDYSIWSYKYDYLGNVKESKDALGNSEIMTYYPSGLLHTMIDRNGTLHTVIYDKNGNPLTKTSVNGLETITKSYTYDSMGNLSTANDGIDAITYTYNGHGYRIGETQGDVEKSINYNELGTITGYTISKNSVVLQDVENIYDAYGRLYQVKENGTVIATYTYEDGRLKTTAYGNGTTETVSYNYAGLPTLVKNEDNGQTVLSSYAYSYYYDGNQYQKAEPAGITTYTYDYMNRLVIAELPDGTLQSYTFDNNSNRESLTVIKPSEPIELTEYTYDANDRLLTEILTIDNTVEKSKVYNYDANGNMLSKSDGTKTITQQFDLFNRMTNYTDGTTVASYEYNPDNMRKSKTVDNVTTRQIWIGSDIVLDISGGNTVSFIYGYRLIKSSYGWYHYNAHGDVVQLTDISGTVTKTYDYDPYGVQRQAIDPNDLNPYRYSGQYTDFESGYVYLRARYYDPSIGRFISQDPALDGHNWYGYCAGNPIMYKDPSGKFLISAFIAGAVIGGLLSGGVNLGSQLYSNGGNWSEVNWKSVGVSTLAGSVGGAFSGGVGSALTSTFSAGASLTIGQVFGVGAFSSIAGGIGNRMVNNTFYNFDAPLADQFNYIFNPASVITDFVVGGSSASIMNGIVRGIDYVRNKNAGSNNSNTYYQATSKENASKIIDTRKLTGIETREVYAWSEQPTLNQAKMSGARSYETVIRFETGTSFVQDRTVLPNLQSTAKVSSGPGPINISNVEEVGFRGEWWQFWK